MEKDAVQSDMVNGNSTPTKITDYFPASPKPIKGVQVIKDTTDILPVDVIASSVLLTPDTSPVKEKETKCNKSDTDSTSSVEIPHCKQIILEEDKSEKKPAKSKPSKSQEKPSESSTNKRKTKSKKNTSEPQLNNSLVTDYFPVRRSSRRCKTEIEKEKRSDLEKSILNKIETGLKVVEIENKGRGVVATKNFSRGDFVVEYAGNLIDLSTAKKKEQQYSEDPKTGCYMYYFTHKSVNYCVDATAESGRLGRLINHSRTAANCHTKLIDIDNHPYLILVASHDIKEGEELLYDYGDRSKSSIESHPWLKL